MIKDELFEEVLLAPTSEGANKLYIVSGYATAAMAFHHLSYLSKEKKYINIALLVGMCPNDGLSLSNHKAFQKLVEADYPDNFQCSYVIKPPAVHSKIYAWYKDEEPLCGYTGSANYTQTAFLKTQREVLAPCDAEAAFTYYNNLLEDTIYCTHPDSDLFVRIYNDKFYPKKRPPQEIIIKEKEKIVFEEDVTGLPFVAVSLLDKSGNVQRTAGLNWGFRQDQVSNRNKNEAYIQLRPEVYKTDFFPRRSIHFTVLTDDNKSLICTRAQKDERGHAIETPHNNSLIGEYFRNRLGLPNGAFVTKDDLVKYGRTDVAFYKIDDETYFMDFSTLK